MLMIVIIEICVGEGENGRLLFQSTAHVNELEGKMKATQNYQDGRRPAYIFS
jgi:hypothetical protein